MKALRAIGLLLLTFLCLPFISLTAYGQRDSLCLAEDASLKNLKLDSVRIHFRQDYSIYEEHLFNNKEAIDSIKARIRRNSSDTTLMLRAVVFVGAASPEGSVVRNQRLSFKRANVIFDHIGSSVNLPDSLMEFHYLGRDWKGLLKAVKADPQVPYREETIQFIEDVILRSADGERESDNNVGRFSRLCGGIPYKYVYDKHFPSLRRSAVYLSYRQTIAMEHPAAIQKASVEQPEVRIERRVVPQPPVKPAFYMALKTNTIYDAGLIPNIGAEFYLGNNVTLGGGWMHSWWSNRNTDWFWRAYGGDLYLRYWFGSQAVEKPLQGHHIGLHGQAFTYDFEIGGRGYMGGLPGGMLKDRAHWGIGVEYGYSLPIARRLNLDFGIALGYVGGEYMEYLPIDGHYVWQVTKKRNWFGPTKAEISLVWLLGRGNYNEER